jgi:sterol desaturase/sphingolipid hydroxylase (fatty acid hydroxylase superfamily)
MNSVLYYEGQIRLIAFLSIFAVMALWELKSPYRELRFKRVQRWPHQLGLIVLNSLLLRLVFPAAAAGVALATQQQQWGLFNLLGLNSVVAGVLGFLLLDLVIYWQHVFAHRLDWFWRLHRTHHADTDYDLTTGLRFHPLEIFISMLIKMAAIWLLGIPVVAVILFEIVLSGSAMFNHANINLPAKVEHTIRKLIVTPGMHRIHHSVERFEHDSNYGFFLSVWDRIFGSYTRKSEQDDKIMPIGLKHFRAEDNHRLDRILSIPFRTDR